MNPPSRLRRLVGVGSRFLVVGALSTLIEVGVFNLLVFVWGWDVVTAKIVASLVALVNAYIGNREWTFRHRDRRGRVSEVVLFLVTNAVCTAIGAGLVWVGVEFAAVALGRAPGAVAVNIVNLASIVIVVLLRFVLYHGIVFRVSPAK
ncbi:MULTISPECIES: GtrA family protein [unclassified Microbacterium]|uniref:GtrA family protein n=1 Tax=unclassified Microbacterium TaxID=2609290 RepID=UPI001604C892|nr:MULTISPECIES: GtrA family protein [unclassified Microbacterium]QNA91983.1 GtrA family protein [Microbacterium sp. Se63.02b]QYM65213.1 GtrA family protein [Microbacterium sp. Se5.02b]